MTAENPVRRKITAREAAKRLGVSTRTVQRIAAEPRDQFLARANQRRATALQMREEGKTYTEIGKALDCSDAAARGLVFHARKAIKASQQKITTGHRA